MDGDQITIKFRHFPVSDVVVVTGNGTTENKVILYQLLNNTDFQNCYY